MSRRRSPRLRWWPMAVAMVVFAFAPSAQTSANTVASTKAKDDSRTIGANDLKPTECAALTLTAKVEGSGTFSGTSASELIVGSAGNDNISAGNGDDCIIGGAGNDTLNGGPGNDVCIGNGGTDIFQNCETQVQ